MFHSLNAFYRAPESKVRFDVDLAFNPNKPVYLIANLLLNSINKVVRNFQLLVLILSLFLISLLHFFLLFPFIFSSDDLGYINERAYIFIPFYSYTTVFLSLACGLRNQKSSSIKELLTCV